MSEFPLLFNVKMTLNGRNVENRRCEKRIEGCSSNGAETVNHWPYRLKLTTDSMRWDSLKITPSSEFDHQMLQKMPDASRTALDLWRPVEVSLYDVDTHETYKVNLAKKEAFWFEPFPDVGNRTQKADASKEQSFSKMKEAARKEFVYSLQPFRHIIRRRNLRYDLEIGLRWSGGKTDNRIDFSVVQTPRLSLRALFAARTEQ